MVQTCISIRHWYRSLRPHFTCTSSGPKAATASKEPLDWEKKSVSTPIIPLTSA